MASSMRRRRCRRIEACHSGSSTEVEQSEQRDPCWTHRLAERREAMCDLTDGLRLVVAIFDAEVALDELDHRQPRGVGALRPAAAAQHAGMPAKRRSAKTRRSAATCPRPDHRLPPRLDRGRRRSAPAPGPVRRARAPDPQAASDARRATPRSDCAPCSRVRDAMLAPARRSPSWWVPRSVQVEQLADQPSSRGRDDHCAGLSQRLQTCARFGTSPTTTSSRDAPSPIRSPTTASPVAIPTIPAAECPGGTQAEQAPEPARARPARPSASSSCAFGQPK